MITQGQYELLCDYVGDDSQHTSGTLQAHVADLLESFEQLHAALDTALMHNGWGSGKTYELMYDEDGNERVKLHAPRV